MSIQADSPQSFRAGYITAAFELFGSVYDRGNYVAVAFSSQRGGRFVEQLQLVLFIEGIKYRVNKAKTKIFIDTNEAVDKLVPLISPNFLSIHKRQIYQRIELIKEDRKQLNEREVFESEGKTS